MKLNEVKYNWLNKNQKKYHIKKIQKKEWNEKNKILNKLMLGEKKHKLKN